MIELLEAPGALKQLATQIKYDIDAYCVKRYDEGPRSHLGASLIGHECSRHLWFSFRWVLHTTYDGRQYRLFQRGHFEEPRFMEYLTGIGCTVTDLCKSLFFHPESESYLIEDSNFQEKNLNIDAQHCIDVTKDLAHIEAARKQGIVFEKGKAQIRIVDCNGHFGGSIDAIVNLPKHYRLDKVIFLGEYKTSGTGRKFDDVVKNGCEVKKYQHFCQQSVYGYKLGIEYGIYMVVNKDNDDLYIEVVKLDWVVGQKMIEKANNIIFTKTPPNRIAANRNFYKCKYCDHKSVCWDENKKVDINCRSCVYSEPVANAEWECSKYGIIPKEAIKNACGFWCPII